MARRGGASGKLRRIKKRGKWVYIVDYYDHEGQRHRPELGPKRDEAKKAMARVLRRRDDEAQRKRVEPSPALGEVLDAHLRSLEVRERSKGHREDVGRTYTRFREMLGDRIPAANVTPADVERMLGIRKDEGASPRSREKEARHLKTVFKWADEQALLEADPLRRYRPESPKDSERKKKRRALSDDETRRLIQAARDDDELQGHRIPQAPLWSFLAVVGSRWTETVSLTWHDVKDGRARFRPGNRKVKQEREPFPLPDYLAEELRRLRRAQGVALERPPRAADPVFLAPEGRPFDTRDAKNLRPFYRVLKAAGIEREDAEGLAVDRHALRGTVCTRLQREGVDEKRIAKLLGASARVILAHYAKPLREDLRAAVEGMPNVLLAPCVVGHPKSERAG